MPCINIANSAVVPMMVNQTLNYKGMTALYIMKTNKDFMKPLIGEDVKVMVKFKRYLQF